MDVTTAYRKVVNGLCMQPCPLNHGVDVRYVDLSGSGDTAYSGLLKHLSPSDQCEVRRRSCFRDRLSFAAGRALLRRMLLEYGVEPGNAQTLEFNSYGKPTIGTSVNVPDVRFNISHSGAIVVVATALAREVGVDVEVVDETVDCMGLARSHFSRAEVQLLEGLPKQSRHRAFFALWTLKEAYTKEQGLGLSISLADFTFALDPPTISFHSAIDAGRGHWFFWQGQPVPGYMMAVAVQRSSEDQVICSPRQIELSELLEDTPPIVVGSFAGDEALRASVLTSVEAADG